MYDNGKIVKVGTKILLCTAENAGLKIEELSDGGVLSAIQEVTDITCNHSDTISGGEYFMLYSTVKNYYVWYAKDNVGEKPYINHATPIRVDVYTDDTADTVAANTAAAIDAIGAFGAVAAGAVITVTNAVGGDVPDFHDGNTYFAFETTTQGEKIMLFDDTLGKDIVQVLDVEVAVDGSAEILATQRFERKTARNPLATDVTAVDTPVYLTLPAGTLAV